MYKQSILLLAIGIVCFCACNTKKEEEKPYIWEAPDIHSLPATEEAAKIKYGRDLIANTAHYLGPKGKVLQISNGMNCQNCHLDAGTRLSGNCFASVATAYPKYRDRSGRVETIAYRINECMERSMNGKELDSNGKEMQAMIAYIKWLGKDVPKHAAELGVGSIKIDFINRAADTAKGKTVFAVHCQRCHMDGGGGMIKPDSGSYIYPPVWGEHSYNVSAGMYRLTRLASFVKYNMPYTGVTVAPKLTDEEAWDVAAYINSKERPEKFFSFDWKDLEKKPVDYPFGPYTDTFSATQHKYGPFTSMNKESKK